VRIAMLACIAVSFGCDRSDPAPALRPEPAPIVAPTSEPASSLAAPWRVRFARDCSEWSGSALVASRRRVIACDGAIYDLEGALRRVDSVGWPSAAVGDHFFFAPTGTEEELRARGEWEPGEDAVVVRDEELHRVAILRGEAELAPLVFGERLFAVGAAAVYTIDLAQARMTALPSAEGCAGAAALDAGGDRIRCVVPCGRAHCLRTVGGSDLPIGSTDPARFVGRDLVVAGEHEVRWIDESGATRHVRPLREAEILAVDGDRALVSSFDGVELERIAGGRLEIERVFDARAAQGVFAGERIVLMLEGRDVVWLERGAPDLPATAAPPVPEGFVALEPAIVASNDDRAAPRAVFRDSDGDEYMRNRTHVAAFVSVTDAVFVSRTDTVELSRFRDGDVRWAQAVAARYLDRGQHRWAKTWRDEHGRRVFRGHTYIGGCERSDIDLSIREDDRGLERWELTEASEGAIERLFGAVPSSAIEVDLGESRYEGDPSIGRVE
jgi:hypothetical protein